jgi:predicted DsbA family dithiol-disulfide isomerase
MKIDIYSDVACPWCYIGQARFERALGELAGRDAVDVRYRPYQLDPRAPASAEPMFDYLERRFGPQARAMANRVIETARGEGLMMDYERGLAVNTLNAHRLLALAEREQGHALQGSLMRRLFAAHFADGLDVGDPTVLAGLAADAGMDEARALAYLQSDAGVREVREEIVAAQLLGVTAVPTYVLDDRYVVQGAQPTEHFRRALQMVEQEETSASGAS